MGANIRTVTAGDLIRQALADGATELGLAKRLADSASDADPEVKRWRYVVRRARNGSEPHETNLTRIAETFDVKPDDLRRPPNVGKGSLRDRLEVLEGEVGRLRTALALAGEAHDELAERVASLEVRRRRREA